MSAQLWRVLPSALLLGTNEAPKSQAFQFLRLNRPHSHHDAGACQPNCPIRTRHGEAGDPLLSLAASLARSWHSAKTPAKDARSIAFMYTNTRPPTGDG